MTNQADFPTSIFRSSLRVTFLLALFCTLMFFALPPAQAQTFQVLHNFTGGRDGAGPTDGLTIDRNGNLYGTASAGGNQLYGCSNGWGMTGCGAVFELARSGSGWLLRPLYDFQGGADNGNPYFGVVFGPGGALYGLTSGSGGGGVFRLTPPPTFCAGFTCNWQETLLHQFTGQPDGSGPNSRVLFDPAGNMYGVTFEGGAYNAGAVYELSPGGGGWTESVIYSFNQNLGVGTSLPNGPLVLDRSGDLYGTAYCNEIGGCFGAVWQLQQSQSGWGLNNIFTFNGFNGFELDGVISDASGNLYGFSDGDQDNGSENAYKLSPSSEGWTYTLVNDLGSEGNLSGPAMDAAGNLYGSDITSGYGTLFKLTRSGDTWTYSVLHTFSGPDGEFPVGTIVVDSSGNLYGTTVKGGSYGYGVIWEITP
jgi:uncharacterized repeat protein (TIGR03803 family)